MKIILASASPRRAELIRRLGCDVKIVPSSAEECALPNAERTAVVNARLKAMSVPADGGIVLGADTVVVSENNGPLGKPHSEEEAFAMLKGLCGRAHEVITAVCLTDGARVAEAARPAFVREPFPLVRYSYASWRFLNCSVARSWSFLFVAKRSGCRICAVSLYAVLMSARVASSSSPKMRSASVRFITPRRIVMARCSRVRLPKNV